MLNIWGGHDIDSGKKGSWVTSLCRSFGFRPAQSREASWIDAMRLNPSPEP